MSVRKIFTGVIACVVLLFVALVLCFWLGIGEHTVYTQINNTRCEAIAPDAGMTQEYTLTAYDEDGTPQTLSFRTERVLRDEAFLALTVAPVRGVTAWEEVAFEALPQEVKAKMGV